MELGFSSKMQYFERQVYSLSDLLQEIGGLFSTIKTFLAIIFGIIQSQFYLSELSYKNYFFKEKQEIEVTNTKLEIVRSHIGSIKQQK